MASSMSLKIIIEKAVNLDHQKDHYIKLSCKTADPNSKIIDSFIGQTRTISNNSNPVWFESFNITIPTPDIYLKFKLYSSTDKFLAQSKVPVWKHLLINDTQDYFWTQLTDTTSLKVHLMANGLPPTIDRKIFLAGHVPSTEQVIALEPPHIKALRKELDDEFEKCKTEYLVGSRSSRSREPPKLLQILKPVDASFESARKSRSYESPAGLLDLLRSSEYDCRSSVASSSVSCSSIESQSPLSCSQSSSPPSYSPLSCSPPSYSPLSYSPLSHSPPSYSPLSYSPLSHSPRSNRSRSPRSPKSKQLSDLSKLPTVSKILTKYHECPKRGVFFTMPDFSHQIKAIKSNSEKYYISELVMACTGTPIKHEKNHKTNWQNWGMTIDIKPANIIYPKNLDDVRNAILAAKEAGRKIRCVGHAHSYTPIYGDDGVDLLFMENVVGISKRLSGPSSEWTIKVLAGTSNGSVMAFMVKNGIYLKTNVISDAFTAAGVISTGSHGSGWNNGLIGDQVVGLEIVNSNGELKSYSKSDSDWKYVSLNLGLYGIIYSVTYQVWPELEHAYTIDYSIDYDTFWNTNLHQIDITSNFFEMLYLPFNDKVWIKKWEYTKKQPKYRSIETMLSTFALWLGTKFGHYINPLISNDKSFLIDPHFFQSLTPLYSKLSFWWLDYTQIRGTVEKPNTNILHIPDALCWNKFLDEIPVWQQEFAINISKDDNGVYNLDAFKDAWYYLKNLIDEVASGKAPIPGLKNKYPINIGIEARVNKNTSSLIGNTYGNDHTFFIEWITGSNTPDYKLISSYISDHFFAAYPSARLHWGKMQEIDPKWKNSLRERLNISEWRESYIKNNIDPCKVFTTKWLEEFFQL